MRLVEVLREDIVDGLSSGEAAEAASSFAVDVMPDGSIALDYDGQKFRIVIEKPGSA